MKFIFVGNRRFVLEEMISLGLNIEKIFVIKNTHLEKDIKSISKNYTLISSKTDLLDKLDKTDFDILISNGCPYILPITNMPNKKYINVHPSLLPDLKGIDPVIGAILYNRNSGATCHIMNDNIDAGDIISQVKIEYSNDLDVSLMYQLSFIAEKEVFKLAYYDKFQTRIKQKHHRQDIYYSRSEQDKIIVFTESIEKIKNKIKAFNNKSQGAYFEYLNHKYKVFGIEILTNEYLLSYAKKFKNYQVLFVYEDTIIFKKESYIVKFDKVVGDLTQIPISSILVE